MNVESNLNLAVGPYEQDIMTLLKCSHEDAIIVEDLMRNEVLHSTLDWLSEAEFKRAAKKAARIFSGDREFFLEAYQERRRVFQQMKKQGKETTNAAPHEV